MGNILTQYRGMNKEIYILFAGKTVTAMGSFVLPMLTFFLTAKLGFDDGTAAFLIATSTLLSLPSALVGGKLADHYSRKAIIVILDFLTVGLYLLAAALEIGYHTAVLIFFAALFQTMEEPAYDALIADFSDTEHRERAFSLAYLGYNLGYIVGASLAGILFEHHTQAAFLINALSVLSSTTLIILFVHMKNAIGQKDDSHETYNGYEKPISSEVSALAVLKERKVVFAMLILICAATIPGTLMGILLPLQLKGFMGEAGAAIFGYLNSLNGFTVILLTPLLTVLLWKFTEIPKSILGYLLFCSGMIIFTLSHVTWLFFVGMFIYSAGEVVSVLGHRPYASKRIPASHRGRIGGIITVSTSLCSALTQYLISGVLILLHSNYPLIWMIFFGIGIVNCLFFAFCYRPDKKTFPILYEKAKL